MKRSPMLFACLACAAFAPLCVAQDLATTAGKHVKVLLDNEKVRVLELQMPPGSSTGMHSHGDNIVVFESGGEANATGADGKVTTVTRKPGEVLWSGPVTHDTRNAGKTTVKTLVIELKEPGGMPAPEPTPETK